MIFPFFSFCHKVTVKFSTQLIVISILKSAPPNIVRKLLPQILCSLVWKDSYWKKHTNVMSPFMHCFPLKLNVLWVFDHLKAGLFEAHAVDGLLSLCYTGSYPSRSSWKKSHCWRSDLVKFSSDQDPVCTGKTAKSTYFFLLSDALKC